MNLALVAIALGRGLEVESLGSGRMYHDALAQPQFVTNPPARRLAALASLALIDDPERYTIETLQGWMRYAVNAGQP